MEDQKTELAEALDLARRESGLSYSAVVRELYDRLGVYALGTVEGVRNYHRAETFPARPDLIQVAALADIYGKRVEDLSPPIADALRVIRDSLGRGAWSGAPC